MLRDFKIFRRQSSKNNVQEGNENLTSNPSDLSSNSAVSVSERAPLNTIQQPLQMLKSASEADLGHMGKIDRPPSSKFKGKGPDAALPFRTPEKLALRSKFGWAQKNDTSANGVEMRDEGRPDGILGTTHLPSWNRGVGQGNGGFSSMTPRAVRNAGKVSSNHSESGSVWSNQSTPTKSVTKPPNPAFAPLNGSRSARAPNNAALSKGVSLSSVPSTVVNTMEVPHFELRENPSFWMDHNVQVLIRVRPLNSTERSTHGYNRCVKQESAQSIAWIGQPENRFTFDHVACETINQEMLFGVAGLPMVENCLSGYNSCIFAYGQTGSGKTYTMLGEIDELEERPSTDRGMTPRIFEFLFARIRAEEDSRQDEKLKYNCKCSFLEIYNEQVTDLLDPSSANLLLREDIRKGVYVENLTEFEVENVSDILKLLVQGASNRKVAATNMNRESSRSHSVFTCVIESRWEKDSTINLRFARLNLVDLAGSERQKTSGAEGERLKEAANINKSLSTLGHVIMLLVDVAHGKQRHVPYRDSRLTFLLQDSLGGNSKTMIIANVSPSICCAAETLSTLKFAQRAKLIQNNAVVNEDASGDVLALQNQIQLLKEELSLLKRQNVSRSLSFRSTVSGDSDSEGIYAFPEGKIPRVDHGDGDVSNGFESSNIVRVSTKQLKSLETTLAGAFRREKMADDAVKKLEAEIEQLNRLVRQREEDTRCTKMMLKFREDKIQRMKSLVDGVIPADSYLLEENNVLAEEVQLLRTRVDKNPEVTRFALENIRLLDQLRRFQDFYEEGEREILLAEVSELRDQLIQLFDGKYGQDKQQNLNIASEGQYSIGMSKDEDLLRIELNNTHEELEDCRNNLKSCLELNAKLTREIDHLQSQLSNLKSVCCNQFSDVKPQKVLDSGLPSEAQTFDTCLNEAVNHKRADSTCEAMMKQDEKILNLELELDILKSILEEERVSRGEVEERICCELEMAKERCLQTSKQCASVQNDLKDARCVIEALESQQFLSISEMEEIRERNDQYMELLRKQEEEISILKKKHDNNFYGNGKKSSAHQEPREQTLKHLENEDSPLQAKLRRMQTSLEKARMLNMRYQSDQVSQTTNDEEMDETRRQVEAETAEVIVCLQEELNALQQQVDESNTKDLEMKRRLTLMEAESKELQERLYLMTQDNERLSELIEKKDEELSSVVEEWERLAYEIADILSNGHDALHDASDQVDFIADSFSQRSWISQQVERIIRTISEKDLLIEELQKCLEDAHKIRSDMEWKLRSLRGATLAITEAQQKESNEKEKELLLLTSQLNAKMSIVTELEERVKLAEDQTKKAEVCAAVAFISVKRMSEINSIHLKALKHKELQLNESIELNLQKETLFQDQILVISEAERQIEALEMQLKGCEERCTELNLKLLKEQEHAHDLEQHLEKVEKEFEVKVADDLLKAKEKLSEFKMGMHTLNSCMNEYVDQTGGSEKLTPGKLASTCVESDDSSINDIKMTQSTSGAELDDVQNNTQVNTEKPVDRGLKNVRIVEDVGSRDLTIILLRKEIESALQSLKGVQAQMTKLTNEKEEANRVEKQSRESIECLTVQVFRLQTEMSDMEKKFEVRMAELNNKLQAAWEMVDDANACISEAKEVLELELSDTKVVAAQKATEASTILAKFEEAQETMKEADVMVNALVAANEASKLEIEKFKKIETALLNEVQNLQSSSFLKEQEHENLEKQFCSSLAEASNLVQALEDLLSEVQTTFKEEFKSIVSDIHGLKSQVLHSTNLTRTWLEDIWSEIVGKDCALSILHLCHIGILLEAVTGLNAENSFLQHGLCASNSVIADLRENNFRAKKELEMCSVIKGKLLIDIKNSFHRITRKEYEAGKLSAKLDMFEKKILDLQLQEELMVSRSNYMSSDLAFLLKELDTNNRNALTALLDQEKLLKERDFICKELDLLIDYPLSGAYENLSDLTAGNRELKEGIESYKDLIRCRMEKIMKDLSAKDFKLLILASELEQKTVEVKKMAYRVVSLEKEHDNLGALLEDMKKEMIFVDVEKGLDKQILLDKLVEVAILEKDVAETHHQLNVVQGLKYELLLKLQESSERIAEMDKEKKALEEETHSLKELAAKQQSDLSYQANQLNELQDLQDEVGLLHDVNSRLQSNLDEKGRELIEIKGCYDAVLKLLQSKEEEMEIQVGRKNLMSSENETLKCELREVTEAREKLSAQVQVLKTENEIFSEDLQTKETTLECSSSRISVLDLENRKLRDDVSFLQSSISALQTELDVKTAELTHIQHFNSIADENFESKKLETIALMGKIDALELENEKLKSKVHNLKSEHSRVLEDLQAKKSDLESCSRSLYISEQKNFESEEAMCSLEACVSSLQRDLGLKDAELKEVCCSRSMIAKELDLRVKAIETQTNTVNELKGENTTLRNEFMFINQNKGEIVSLLKSNTDHLSVAMQALDMMGTKIFEALDGNSSHVLIDTMFQQICEFEEMVSKFIRELECLELSAEEIIFERSSLQAELVRKEDVLKGLQFDLSLLQESSSNVKDQKDEFEKIVRSLESAENELALKTNELDVAVAHCQMLETQLLEKAEKISSLEMELSTEQESVNLFSGENLELKAQMEDLLVTKTSIEEELNDKSEIIERLNEELLKLSGSHKEMSCYIQNLKDDLSIMTSQRDALNSELHALEKQLEMAQALAEENEAIAAEARQGAEARRTYAEEKEEEVKLLETSVEELERTINVLENKVEIVEREAERQRLQREELEMERQNVRHQILAVHNSGETMNSEIQNVTRGVDDELPRHIEEKLKDLKEAQKKIQHLEKDVAAKDAEIAQCKAHISELNMHAEAQAQEYKQKFKALEAMAQEVKPEHAHTNSANLTATKSEKNAAKSRGSGSPFKCIGLGLTHQINSEKDEELSAGRQRIEELEALAASRQKEIFMLNARLAAAESMTHDVIRDLLGVKLDMTNYASLMDHQQVQKLTEKVRFHSEEAQEKEQEVIKLKKQLNEFIEERQSWLDEINRRHAETVALQVALEKLRQRDHFLTTENDMLKVDNGNHKKKIMELEDEVKKLSGQQNLQQRIHHHAKVKEENNVLKTQNENLSAKLQRTEVILSRVKEELAHYRSLSGKNPYIDIDEEQCLKSKLEDTEEERVQLAQKLLSLCTSILKAAGITRPPSNITLSVAEEALNQLKDRIASMEQELHDWRFKSKISSEKIWLSELRQQPLPLISRTDENCPPRKMSITPPLSTTR